MALTAAALAVLFGFGACGDGKLSGGGSDDDDDPGTYDAGDPQPAADGGAECACSDCVESWVGAGTVAPFDTTADENEFVSTDMNGALFVDKSNSKYNKFLWVADTDLPGVVKIDLTSLQIVGRYRTGGGSTSRTTVNVLGEAFIGARTSSATGGPGVTKIYPYGQDCPDTNGDGVITTSSGRNDVLPWGQDDCVAWHTETDGDIRGLAAQDIPGVDLEDACTGGDDTQVEVPDEHYVWIGGMHGKIYKLDAETGAILLEIHSPSGVYGMALSGDGKIWTANQLSFVDTFQCTDQASCEAAPVCVQSCQVGNCPATCDGAVKARFSGPVGYGITVDCKNRVWLSQGQTTRYDPSAPPANRLALGPTSGSGGIAADADGWIWASNGATTTRIDAETMAGVTVFAANKGVAVDSDGRVFTIQNRGVHLVEAGPTLNDYSVTANVVTLDGFAYAYSDMTGVQTRLASDGPGWYRHVFEGCVDHDSTDWRNLEWEVEAPTATFVMFSVRSANTYAELASSPWQPVANCLDAGGCSHVGIGQQEGRYLEVEVRLTATDELDDSQRGCVYDPGQSARVKRFGVRYACSSIIE